MEQSARVPLLEKTILRCVRIGLGLMTALSASPLTRAAHHAIGSNFLHVGLVQ